MADVDSEGAARTPLPGVAWLARGLETLPIDLPVDLPIGTVDAAAPHDQDADADADLVIVGSGYGAAVTARQFVGCQRNGRALRIAVLERGNEYLSGAFPSRLAELPGHIRFSTPGSKTARGRRSGLFDVRLGVDVMALVANGVGGGSLINAGVMLEPDPAVFNQPHWPAALRQSGVLEPHFEAVRGWLGAGSSGQPNTVAGTALAGLGKTAALQTLPTDKRSTVPITVALRDGTRSVAGVPLAACIACGDCATGCNHGAKNSLDVGLLAQSCTTQADGDGPHGRALLYAGATVLWLEKQADGHWTVVLQHTDDHLRLREARPFRLRTRLVVLAAGSLGSTEILLRSRQRGLALSPLLGHRFSTNGDAIASLQGVRPQVNAVAHEDKPPQTRAVGPTITSMVDLRAGADGFVVQELAVPGPVRQVFAELFTTAGVLHALRACDRDQHAPQDTDPCAVDNDQIDHHTLPVAMIGHDDSGGRLSLVTARTATDPTAPDDDTEGDGALRIDWPGLKDATRWPVQQDELAGLLAKSGLGGTLLPNPVWQLLPRELQDSLEVPRGPLLTVHPLGGCPMGDDRQHGVVDDLGRVFDAAAADPRAVHTGLAVLDGAIVPTSLGINPALTIAALAHRAAQALRGSTGWHLGDNALPPLRHAPRPVFQPPRQPGPVEPTRIELVERMRGDATLSSGLRATVELTLFSQPTEVRTLMQPQPDRCIQIDPARSQLRVWAGALAPLQEDPPDDDLLLSARLGGTLTILRHGDSRNWPRTLRALAAWLVNRGVRDAVQRYSQPGGTRGLWQDLGNLVPQTLALASRAGTLRTLDYALTVHSAKGALAPLFRDGSAVGGTKRLQYGLQASPLQQLMDMQLTAFPALAIGETPTLSLHLPFLAQEAVPLLRVVGQANQPQALADLASLLAYLTRVLVNGHLWSFRKPDRASTRMPQRLPGRVPGAPPPQVTEIEVAPAQAADAAENMPAVPAARIRLTRYCPERPDTSLPPVLLIHGYSASGTTFAHPTLQPGLMAHLTVTHRRDVWVLDMRSSCGMPTATHPWTFEEMGCEDIPVAVEQVCQATGFASIDIVAHCMGVAMLFMGLLGQDVTDQTTQLLPALGRHELARGRLWDRNLSAGGGDSGGAEPGPEDPNRPRSRIRRLVMSQVGPMLRLTPANIGRAYLMRYAQQFLAGAGYQFSSASEPGLADQLLDRLLAAMPYPPGEFRRENPFWPLGQHLPWVGTRHRIDALFGRVFNLAGMDDATLEHIDDFFGPFNVDTVSQVIYFMRYWMITDRSGFNRFIHPQLIRKRLRFRMLSLHARSNGLADVSTGALLLEQIRPHLEHPDWLDCRTMPNADLGHQDALIGCERTTTPVLQAISAFLQQPMEADDAR